MRNRTVVLAPVLEAEAEAEAEEEEAEVASAGGTMLCVGLRWWCGRLPASRGSITS